MGRLRRPCQGQFGGDVIGMLVFGELDESPQQASCQTQLVSQRATYGEIFIQCGSQ
jgi:hypothetical protein